MSSRNSIGPLEGRRSFTAVVDLDFGDAGRTAVDVPTQSITALADGAILTVNRTPGIVNNVTMSRLDADGNLDGSFAYAPTPAEALDQYTLVSGNRAYVIGQTGVNGRPDARRYFVRAVRTSGGRRDPTFGADGTLVFRPGSFGRRQPGGAAVFSAIATPGGGLLLALNGTRLAAPVANSTFLCNLRADGTFDDTFGGDGTFVYGDDLSFAVLADDVRDGTFLLLDRNDDDLDAQGLHRFRWDGEVDAGFGIGGRVPLRADDVRVQGDGKIITTAARSNDGGDSRFAVRRLNANGSDDVTFGDGGSVVYEGRLDLDVMTATDPAGRLVVAFGGGAELERLTADGAPDVSFGVGGTLTLSSSQSGLASLAIDADGRLLAGAGVARGVTRVVDRDAVELRPSGRLDINGTNGDDVIGVRLDGNDIVASVNGVTTRYPAGDVKTVVMDGFDGNDVLFTAGNPPAALRGGAGAHRFSGGDSAGRIYGGGGDDTISGAADDDRLYGEDGDDRIEGGSGNDSINGSGGDDVLHGIAGRDSAYTKRRDRLTSIERLL